MLRRPQPTRPSTRPFSWPWPGLCRRPLQQSRVQNKWTLTGFPTRKTTACPQSTCMASPGSQAKGITPPISFRSPTVSKNKKGGLVHLVSKDCKALLNRLYVSNAYMISGNHGKGIRDFFKVLLNGLSHQPGFILLPQAGKS